MSCALPGPRPTMNRTGRCGHASDCACAAADTTSAMSAAIAAAETIDISFDMELSQAGCRRASIGDAPGRSTRAVWFRPPRVPGAAQRERLKAFTLVSAGDGRVVRCRPGIVTHTAFATVPDQRCTASLSLALHRIRDT